MSYLTKSKHADLRAKQRGVSDTILQALFDHADVDHIVGDGCRVMRLSRAARTDRSLREKLGATLDRIACLAMIWSDDRGQVVTILHDHGKKNGRRYRRSYH